jgi:hypothetical protein
MNYMIDYNGDTGPLSQREDSEKMKFIIGLNN